MVVFPFLLLLLLRLLLFPSFLVVVQAVLRLFIVPCYGSFVSLFLGLGFQGDFTCNTCAYVVAIVVFTLWVALSLTRHINGVESLLF